MNDGGEVYLYTDGGSRGNPGPAGAGFVLVDAAGGLLTQGSRYLGVTTNNVAEYRAVILGLSAALPFSPRALRLRADSELLVRQLTGAYRVRSPHLRPLFDQVRTLLLRFPSWDAAHVPREDNAWADELANQAMDRAAGERETP